MGNELFDCFLLIQSLEEAVKVDAISRLYGTSSSDGQADQTSDETSGDNGKKVKLFSEEQINGIVKLVNADEQRQELGKTALVNALRQYDEVLRESRPRGELKNIRIMTKNLTTRIGDIPYSRTLYKEKLSGNPKYLLDEAMGLDKNQRMSLRMTEIMGLLASVEPYRNAQEQLSKLLGISWSHEAIRQNVIREGKRIEEQEAKKHKKIKELDYELPRERPETVYNETDATYIRKQNKTKKKGRKKRHLEVKLGVGYTGKEARYKDGRKKSKKLNQRIVFADIKADRNEFLDKFSCLNEKEFGLSAVKNSYLGGDGDTWIREGKKEYFTNSKYLLCPFHLFRNLRRALNYSGLYEENISEDPLIQFEQWMKEAIEKESFEPNSMTLATASKDGTPSARTVLLKDYGPEGFVFFTNFKSRKGKDLADNPRASLVFYWGILSRQILIDGEVKKTKREVSVDYFHSRPRTSQIAAYISNQSEVIADRKQLEDQMKKVKDQFKDQEIPCPDQWGGYCLVPQRIEFWQGRPDRLHDRLCYTKTDDHHWKRERLAP